jgi:hypothetical protein
MVFQQFDHDAHPLKAIGSRGVGAEEKDLGCVKMFL